MRCTSKIEDKTTNNDFGGDGNIPVRGYNIRVPGGVRATWFIKQIR